MIKPDKNLPASYLKPEIQIDLQAPMDVVREVVQRNFRETLNKTCGDSFLFYVSMPNGKDKILTRNKESGTYSKDYAPFMMNQKTLIGAPTFTLIPEPNTKPKLIPEFVEVKAAGGAASSAVSDSVTSD